MFTASCRSAKVPKNAEARQVVPTEKKKEILSDHNTFSTSLISSILTYLLSILLLKKQQLTSISETRKKSCLASLVEHDICVGPEQIHMKFSKLLQQKTMKCKNKQQQKK